MERGLGGQPARCGHSGMLLSYDLNVLYDCETRTSHDDRRVLSTSQAINHHYATGSEGRGSRKD